MPEIAPLPDILPDDLQTARTTLPLKPDPVTLTGKFIELRPLDMGRDLEPLYCISDGSAVNLGDRHVEPYDPDSILWRFMSFGPFQSIKDFEDYLLRQHNAPNVLPFTVFDLALNHQVGMATYMNNRPADLVIELGSIWYSPIAQRTPANTEATYLMLDHAFKLGYRRLEWKCNALNERSRRAALRMGFKFEGIQENHMIVKNRSRDTAWFRILDDEWAEVKRHLESLLYSSSTS